MASGLFWQGVEQFNRQAFYACHDTLEALWMEAPEWDRNFYQGILQIAVGCHHLSNHNWRGAVILLGEGMGRLQAYEPSYHGIDLERLLADSAQLLEALHQAGEAGVAQCARQLAGGEAQGAPQIVPVATQA